MWAILSDIHGNLEALQAVLADAAEKGAEKIICLGDTVGYGPDPNECVSLSMSWEIVMQGHFEAALLSNDALDGWGARALAESILWYRDWINRNPEASRQKDFLANLPRLHEENGVTFVHGSPRNHLYEYLFPEEIYNQPKLERVGQCFDRCCFVGHTHVPGFFIRDAPEKWEFLCGEGWAGGYQLDDRKMICNPGSVGRSGDGDWRASYLLFDGNSIRFRRVEYDVDATVRKIYANPHLDDWLGDHLIKGR